VGAILLTVSAITALVTGVAQIAEAAAAVSSAAGEQRDAAVITLVVVAVITLAIGLASLFIAWRVFLGKPRMRFLAMVFSVATVVLQIVETETGDPQSVAGNLPSVALAVLVLLALSSQRARTYVHRIHKAPKRISGLPGQVAPF
jgi:O-antigen/teichoic acid export membrane protein